MKSYVAIIVFLFIAFGAQAQSDQELNRDSVIGWQYVSNPINSKAIYKPVKGLYAGGAYSAWQQQASDLLLSWIQQSYLPRGLIVRTIAKNDERWYVDDYSPLHSYGINLLGYSAHFVNGKIDLKCCEQGLKLIAGFNDFPGVAIKKFNPGGLYFFAEEAQFSSGDDDAQLSKEGIDKKIQPNLYNYRTYLDHYHDAGQQMFKVGVVVSKNGDWPFKPVLVKDAVAYIQQQLAAYPAILQKNPYSAEPVKKALERLKPYYNEVVKLRANYNPNNAINDNNDHYLLDPEAIINGNPINKTFPEHSILVSTTQQTIDQSKTDNPLWVYFNFTPLNRAIVGNPAKFDTKFGTDISHMVYSLLNNFNFDYVARWLAQPDARKSMAYTPVKAPAKSTGNIFSAPAMVSVTASTKNKDPYTILYDDFNGYTDGTLSAKVWHTYGHNGHDFANASVSTVNGQSGKWISVPQDFSFYPNFNKPLGANFTVNYDVYFGKNVKNQRTPFYFRIDTEDPKKSNPIDLHDINREGFQFSLAMSGETETSKRYMSVEYKETFTNTRIPTAKAGDVAHVTISVNGAAIAVSVNGKELMHDDNAIPAGKSFRRYAWYCSEPGVYFSNVYVKSGSPVQNTIPQEPQFAGVVKDKKSTTPDAATFETSDYAFKPLEKIGNMPPISYPAGFKSATLIPAQAEGSNKAVATLPPFKAPSRSALLDAIPNTVLSNAAFKKLIDDLKNTVSTKLNTDNVNKIDGYLKAKKITAPKAIAAEAIGAWLSNKPTAALYLFCKAMQADYNVMNTANNLASLLNAYGYSEKAIPVLQYVNGKINNNPDVLSNMATAYYNLGDMNNASLFADKSIAKDSLNANGNKVAAFVHLGKASATNNKAEADKAIGCLKQVLKSRYDNEAAEILNKIEGNHQKQKDFANTNFKEFPMLRRLELPAMTEDLAQAKSFNGFLEKEKTALSQTADDIRAAYKKIPEADMKQVIANINQNKGTAMMMVKAANIVNQSAAWYIKLKSDLEQIFTQNKRTLTTAYNKKISAITKKYNALLNKLEGGEGKVEEEEEMERLKKARCEEYNKESQIYLSDLAKLTNQFAQKSELVSRTYFRDYANWMPVQLNDNSNRFLLDAQVKYITDVRKILSVYTVAEPCIYPSQEAKEDKKPSKPKPWEEDYCANFKGTLGIGPAKIGFNCNSMSISGGEGFVGELNLNFNENGTFKEATIGAGIGIEGHIGNQNVTAVSAGASAVEYITVGAGPNGGVQVTDWGISAGVSAGGNIGAVSGEANIASTNISVNEGIKASGYIANVLGLNKP